MKLAAIAASAVLMTACSAGQQECTERELFAMDTYMTLKAYGDNAGAALTAAEARIRELESLMSVTAPDSDVSRVNSSSGEPITVSEDTAAVIGAALEYADLTDGALDITIYPVLQSWGFTTDTPGTIPDDENIRSLLSLVDYRNVHLDGIVVTVPRGYMIDLGSVAKGYTGDQIAGIFHENGVDSAIVTLGGNVQAIGSKPDGKPWSVAVRSPFDDTLLGYIEVTDKAVVTSGSYERYFVGDDGKQYHHIIDPSDGYPADNGLVSVTIIAENGTMCDALSTALFVAGADRAAELWRTRDDFEMILVNDAGKLLYTEGLVGSFRNSSKLETEVIRRD